MAPCDLDVRSTRYFNPCLRDPVWTGTQRSWPRRDNVRVRCGNNGDADDEIVYEDDEQNLHCFLSSRCQVSFIIVQFITTRSGLPNETSVACSNLCAFASTFFWRRPCCRSRSSNVRQVEYKKRERFPRKKSSLLTGLLFCLR